MSGTSRSSVILETLAKEIASRRAHLDAATDLTVVTVTIKLEAGTSWVRGTSYTEEHLVRVRSGRDGR